MFKRKSFISFVCITCVFITILKQTHALHIAITQNITLHYTLCKKQKQTQQTQNILAVLKRIGALGVCHWAYAHQGACLRLHALDHCIIKALNTIDEDVNLILEQNDVTRDVKNVVHEFHTQSNNNMYHGVVFLFY